MCSAIFSDSIALEDVEERPIAVLIGLLEDVVEVADGLMIVQDEDEADGVRHRWRLAAGEGGVGRASADELIGKRDRHLSSLPGRNFLRRL